jgi:hypothetical protein
VPKEVVFQTKPQLAAAMVRRLHESGTLPFRYIGSRTRRLRIMFRDLSQAVCVV